MAKPPSTIAAVQEFFASLPAARDLKTGCFFAADLGRAGKAAKLGQVWFIAQGGPRKRVTVTRISADDAFMQVGAHDELGDRAIPVLDAMQIAAESLVDQVAAHADAVERRGNEIDDLLAQIRANMSDSRAV